MGVNCEVRAVGSKYDNRTVLTPRSLRFWIPCALLLAWFMGAVPLPAQRWEIQYFFDKRNANLEIHDLKFLSAVRGVAVATLTEGRSSRPVCLVTNNGGDSWDMQRLREPAISVFFLNESVGWMVSPAGIWKTVESGRSWAKLPGVIRGALQVYFLDENRGWAIGERKGAYQTTDGGRSWSRLAALDQVNSRTENTVFLAIAFAGASRGLIVGHSIPPASQAGRRGREAGLPDWLSMGRGRRREQPHLLITLETQDGGKTWKPATASAFGRVPRVVFRDGGGALALFQFLDDFAVPAEIYQLNVPGGSTARVFARRDRAITDLATTPRGETLIAAIEPPGEVAWTPMPGKLKVHRSLNLGEWTEMDVDYRAIARRAVLAVFDDEHAWAATDTGMILRLRSR